MAFFAGLKLQKFELNSATVSVPFNWITKNPFKSMYFAVQSMAAEFSTAVLLVRQIEESKANIALIIVSLQADFLKRAQTKTSFTCAGGALIETTIQKVIHSDDPETITLETAGKDLNGEVVSTFKITWSLKKRG